MAKKSLKNLSASKTSIFKIRNRRGYAAVCLNNLTEGKTAVEAFNRMAKAVRRMGFQFTGAVPKAR